MIAIPFAAMLISFVPAVVGLRFSSRLDAAMRIILIYLCLAFVSNVLSIVLAMNSSSNLWLIRIFTPLELALLIAAFAVWQRRFSMRLVLVTCILVFLGIFAHEAIQETQPVRFNHVSKTVSAGMLLLLSSISLITLRTNKRTGLVNIPQFWVSTALLVQFGASFVVYGVNNYLVAFPAYVAIIPWAIKAVASIGGSLLFTGAYLCYRNQ